MKTILPSFLIASLILTACATTEPAESTDNNEIEATIEVVEATKEIQSVNGSIEIVGEGEEKTAPREVDSSAILPPPIEEHGDMEGVVPSAESIMRDAIFGNDRQKCEELITINESTQSVDECKKEIDRNIQLNTALEKLDASLCEELDQERKAFCLNAIQASTE